MFLRFHRNLKQWTAGGQVSTMLVFFIAATLTLTMVTFNVGKVTLSRTSTSIAADAAALAAASWVASMENELASIGRTMWLFYTIWWAYFLIPVWGGSWHMIAPAIVYILYLWTVYYVLKLQFNSRADDTIAIGAKRAAFETIMTAIANANIDDNRDISDPESLQAKLKAMGDTWANDQSFPQRKDYLGEAGNICLEGDTSGQKMNNPYFEHTWDRNPDDPARGENKIVIEADFPCAPPYLIYDDWAPVPKVWTPKIWWCGWTAPGWKIHYPDKGNWLQKWLPLTIPSYKLAIKTTCFPIPVFLSFMKDVGPPNEMDFPNNDIRVIVRRYEQDANLRLWTMKYGNPDAADPTEVSSMAVGSYSNSSVHFSLTDWPNQDATFKLGSVQ